MKIKVGYYPMLDAVLAVRQIFDIERFRPFCSSLESIALRLSNEEKEAINLIGAATNEWLDVIENIMIMTMDGISSPEELLIKSYKNPECLYNKSGEEYMVTLLSNVWYNYCFIEMSKYFKKISEKAMEISQMTSKEELIDYILGLSDRIERGPNNTIKFNIKPDLSVPMDEIENIIVMPSVFSSRNVTFWYRENTFLFYVALESKTMKLEEPSDMLLIRTLAFNDKTRLKILKALTRSALSVNDIAEKMNINASTASRHLKVFKDVGFVDIQSQEGNSIYYYINEQEIRKAMKDIYDYIFKGEIE